MFVRDVGESMLVHVVAKVTYNKKLFFVVTLLSFPFVSNQKVFVFCFFFFFFKSLILPHHCGEESE